MRCGAHAYLPACHKNHSVCHDGAYRQSGLFCAYTCCDASVCLSARLHRYSSAEHADPHQQQKTLVNGEQLILRLHVEVWDPTRLSGDKASMLLAFSF